MAAFVPVIYGDNGTYVIPINITRPGSPFFDVEFIPGHALKEFVKEASVNGQVVEPRIIHGLH